jgi:hypothetical protein
LPHNAIPVRSFCVIGWSWRRPGAFSTRTNRSCVATSMIGGQVAEPTTRPWCTRGAASLGFLSILPKSAPRQRPPCLVVTLRLFQSVAMLAKDSPASTRATASFTSAASSRFTVTLSAA